MDRHPHRTYAFLCAFLLVGPGCGPRLIMIERPKGEIEMRRPESAQMVSVTVDPATASLSKTGVDVIIRYASPAELDKFFENKEIFGNLASKNPYPPETLVFYVKIANHSSKKIKVIPDNFVLIDNLNIQYAELSPDNISAIYEAKANAWTFAKTTGDLAPGPYGAPLKVAGVLAERGGRKIHYLIKQVRLAEGYVYPGIAYDGYVAFPRPHPNSTSIRLMINGIKTDFSPSGLPAADIDFEFSLNFKYSKS